MSDAKNGSPPPRPPLPPPIQQVVDMQPAPRQCIFFIDQLAVLIPAMQSQLALIGGERFCGVFGQMLQGLHDFRAQVVAVDGSGIVVAQPGDVPPRRPQ